MVTETHAYRKGTIAKKEREEQRKGKKLVAVTSSEKSRLKVMEVLQRREITNDLSGRVLDSLFSESRVRCIAKGAVITNLYVDDFKVHPQLDQAFIANNHAIHYVATQKNPESLYRKGKSKQDAYEVRFDPISLMEISPITSIHVEYSGGVTTVITTGLGGRNKAGSIQIYLSKGHHLIDESNFSGQIRGTHLYSGLRNGSLHLTDLRATQSQCIPLTTSRSSKSHSTSPLCNLQHLPTLSPHHLLTTYTNGTLSVHDLRFPTGSVMDLRGAERAGAHTRWEAAVLNEGVVVGVGEDGRFLGWNLLRGGKSVDADVGLTRGGEGGSGRGRKCQVARDGEGVWVSSDAGLEFWGFR
ncbi:hypothetical protein HDU67_008863 [Dinochytrium kinnereticum]|nr:hypothetical protein HDU67_008863 [Dinochytrium kinnereticum]